MSNPSYCLLSETPKPLQPQHKIIMYIKFLTRQLVLGSRSDVVDKTNQRVFTIYLNNFTTELKADVVGWTGRNGVAWHKDYIVNLPSGEGIWVCSSSK